MSALKRLLAGSLIVCATGCATRHRVVEPEPVDDWDQQQWANTSPVGDGELNATGYYGVGSAASPEAPVHAAANPQPRYGGREAASPKSTKASPER